MSKPVAIVTEFVMGKLPAEPVAKRAQMYRALAAISATNAGRKKLLALAAECEAIDAAHEQLAFDFRRRARGKDGNGAGKN